VTSTMVAIGQGAISGVLTLQFPQPSTGHRNLTSFGNGPGQRGYACSDVPQRPPSEHSRWGASPGHVRHASANERGTGCRARSGSAQVTTVLSFTVTTIVHRSPYDCMSMQIADRPQLGTVGGSHEYPG